MRMDFTQLMSNDKSLVNHTKLLQTMVISVTPLGQDQWSLLTSILSVLFATQKDSCSSKFLSCDFSNRWLELCILTSQCITSTLGLCIHMELPPLCWLTVILLCQCTTSQQSCVFSSNAYRSRPYKWKVRKMCFCVIFWQWFILHRTQCTGKNDSDAPFSFSHDFCLSDSHLRDVSCKHGK